MKLSPVAAVAAVLAQLILGVGFVYVANNAFVAQVARNDFQLHFPVQRNTEIEHLFARLRRYLFAVRIQGDFLAVGVYFDACHRLRAVDIAFPAKVHEGFFAPVRLVAVEAVLLRLAVEGHDALVVHAGFAALISRVRRKVEHIPKVSRPKIRTLFKEFEHIFVVLALIFFALIAALGVRTMQVGHTFATVFGVTEATVGIYEVEEIRPKIVEEHTGHVPPKIQIPADEVGDMRGLIEVTAHGVASKGGGTGRVELVHQIVQNAVVVEHILLVLRGNGNFVGKSPETDGRVVVILRDELLHL